MAISKAEKLKLCKGCHNDFYNGNNNIGVDECWHLKNAKVVRKKVVHINQVPPWKQAPVRMLSCRYVPQFVFTEHEY